MNKIESDLFNPNRSRFSPSQYNPMWLGLNQFNYFLIVNHWSCKNWIIDITIHAIDSILGHYLYLEASGKKNGDKATLISPSNRYATPQCLTFKAHMLGSQIGTLSIEKQEGSSRTELFKATGAKDNKWHSFNVNLPAGGPYQVLYIFTTSLMLKQTIRLWDRSYLE